MLLGMSEKLMVNKFEYFSIFQHFIDQIGTIWWTSLQNSFKRFRSPAKNIWHKKWCYCEKQKRTKKIWKSISEFEFLDSFREKECKWISNLTVSRGYIEVSNSKFNLTIINWYSQLNLNSIYNIHFSRMLLNSKVLNNNYECEWDLAEICENIQEDYGRS